MNIIKANIGTIKRPAKRITIESYPEQYISNVWEAAKMASSEGAENPEGADGAYGEMQYNNVNGYQDNADGDYEANSTLELTEKNLQEYNEYNENSTAEE